MNIKKVERAITSKTRAIIATHIYNFPLRIDLLKKFCKKKKNIHYRRCGGSSWTENI